jgi:hypothetical protein
MAESVVTADGQRSQAVHDDPEHAPPPGPGADKGWTWDRGARAWKPKVRGPVLWFPGSDGEKVGAPEPAAEAAPGPEPDSGHDPEPAWMQEDSKPARRKRRQSIEDVPKETVDDMAGLAGLVGAPVLALLQQADPYCGSVLAQNYEPIIDAVLPLLCRSEKIVKYFSGDQSDWLLWGKLAMALAPVGRAILEHHVFRSVEVVRDPKTGTTQVVRRETNPGHGDHLVPPAPASFEYAA